ncbi:tetratricopeptide repeat protein [uncultured Alistipes sp.]|uniref:tetratricopeptide repeat protein n=1 Tax=uncultured Alistipes sp. TaxID=538949 RepID=UPI0026122D27|nr:tetratricopeptide repeat protein [uncultured Alistipes sp.]
MYKALHILLLMLFVATGAVAQRMPERAQVRKGTREYHKGNYEEAIKRYESALTLVPGQFEATYDLGNALYKAEMYDRAEQTMMQAAADTLRSDAERAEAWYNLGNARFKQQKYQEALESYRQSLRLNPDDMEAKYNYAYTKRLLDKDNQGGGGGDDQQDQDQQNRQDQNQNQQGQQDQDKNKDQNQDQNQDQDKDGQQDPQQGDGQQNPQQDPQQGEGGEQPVESGISEQEQQQILDAIQAQEDRTQEKLKEKQGVVVRGRKNW